MRRYVPSWWNSSYMKDPDGKRGTIDTQGNEFVIKIGRGVGYVRPCSYYNYEIWNNCNKDLRHDNQVNWFSVDKFIYNNPNISDNPYRYNTQIPKTPSIAGILSLITKYMSKMKKDPISHMEDIRTGIYSGWPRLIF